MRRYVLGTIGGQLPSQVCHGALAHGAEFAARFHDMSVGVPGRVLRPAVTRQAHQPGRRAVETQNTLSDLLRRQHGYNLLSGADDVDNPAGGKPRYELGQRAA